MPAEAKKPPAKARKPVAGAPGGVKTAETPETWPFGTAPEAPADLSGLTPLDYLLSIVRDVGEEKRIRMQAASIAAPYLHAKAGEAGKKDAKNKAAKTAGTGKFAAAAPPLKLVNVK